MPPADLAAELDAADRPDPSLVRALTAAITSSNRHATFSRDALRHALEYFDLLTPTARRAVHDLIASPGNVQHQDSLARQIVSAIERKRRGLV